MFSINEELDDYRKGGYVNEMDILGLDVVFDLDPTNIVRSFQDEDIMVNEGDPYGEHIVILFEDPNDTRVLSKAEYSIQDDVLTLNVAVDLSRGVKLLVKRPFLTKNTQENTFQGINENIDNLYKYIDTIVKRMLLSAYTEQSKKSIPKLKEGDMLIFGETKRLERLNFDDFRSSFGSDGIPFDAVSQGDKASNTELLFGTPDKWVDAKGLEYAFNKFITSEGLTIGSVNGNQNEIRMVAGSESTTLKSIVHLANQLEGWTISLEV